MPSPASEQATLLDCDVIMKGGISSGVVYPRAVVALSRKYRLRQVGGASAGAIAATMAAAAELGRRRQPETGHDVGVSYAKLDAIPSKLGTTLPSLFQPSPGTATAFDALMAWLDPGRSTTGKLLATVGLLIRRAWLWFTLTAMALMVPALAFDIALLGRPRNRHDWWGLARALLVWIPVALLVALVVAAVTLLLGANRHIAANGFGVCNGHRRRTPASPLPLTDWMEQQLRDLAGPDPAPITGKHPADRPVCFGDLWGQEAAKAYREAFVVTPKDGSDPYVDYSSGEAQLNASIRRSLRTARQTDCLVMTTNLSHRRPYRFPFDTQQFWWCKACLGEYFPENVVRQMESSTTAVPTITTGKDNAGAPIELVPRCSRHPEQPLYYMPLAPDIPLVVAARVSLSFPGLICAVPFQAIDWTRTDEHRGVVTVWFSDGGISSNFPMRFFDAAWPSRPTFGINLAPPHPDFPEMVWRAKPGSSGRLPTFIPLSSLAGFVGSILDTMQNWTDTVQITMPGFRDRIVIVRQNKDEGGMNLKMSKPTIEGLAERGQQAGENITNGVADPLDPSVDVPPFDFDTHRWIRYRDAMAGIDELLTGMHDSWDFETPGDVEDMASFIHRVGSVTNRYRPGAHDFEATQRAMDLAATFAELDHPASGDTVPRPVPDLRLTPPL
jgi:Patatin-like phospholipase